MNHGLALRAARIDRGISLDEMAERMKISSRDLSLIEHNARLNRNWPEVLRIARLLDVTLTPSEADNCGEMFDPTISEKYRPVTYYRRKTGWRR